VGPAGETGSRSKDVAQDILSAITP
jgi:hypothetical protein